jgi:hypothetical protein
MDDSPSFDLVAASLRADTADLDVFFPVLADKLSEAIPDRVHLQRAGLMGRGAVREVAVKLENHTYRLSRDGQGLTASRARIVRGIVLQNEQLSLDEWIDALSRDLADEARTSERSRLALERLLTRS